MPNDPAIKKKESATSHGASGKRLGEPEPRSIKKGMATDNVQTGRMGFRPAGKKGKKGELPNGGIEKGVVSAYPKTVAGHRLSKEPKPKEGKDEKTGNRTC